MLHKNFNVTYEPVVLKENSSSALLEDHVILFVPKDENYKVTEIMVNSRDLLHLFPGKKISSTSGRFRLAMPSISSSSYALNTVIVKDKITKREICYTGFHKFRQEVRKILCDDYGLLGQIEKLNREIAIAEIQAYKAYFDSIQDDGRFFFTRYFCERFPQQSKIKFNGNIGDMFRYYRNSFLLPGLPVVYYTERRRSYRTRYRDGLYGREPYAYPMFEYYEVARPTYDAKVITCMVMEMDLCFPFVDEKQMA